MVAESLEKLDAEWSFERDNSIGTGIGKYVIDPMFDSEFLSIFNAIYPCLKKLEINQPSARDIFKELLRKVEDPDKKVAAIVDVLYSKLQEFLPVDKFIVERHLQNWVAKRIYTETILLPPNLSTHDYFFLGSITKNGRVDSASRGHGITLSQLIKVAGPETARVALLLSFGTPHKDYEWSSTLKQAKEELKKFNDFIYSLKNYSAKEDIQDIKSVLLEKRRDIENLVERGNTRKILLILFNDLPEIIKPMLVDSRPKNNNREILKFFDEYLEIFCSSLSSKIHEN